MRRGCREASTARQVTARSGREVALGLCQRMDGTGLLGRTVLEIKIYNRMERKSDEDSKGRKRKSLFWSAKRYLIFPLDPCIDNMGVPHLATWGRAFSAVKNPLPFDTDLVIYRPDCVPTKFMVKGKR